MIININEMISDETFNKLVTAFNALREYERVTVYLNTLGGDVEAMEAILDLINYYPEKFELIANAKIYSAGFIIFFRAMCPKRILPGTTGMTHFIRVGVGINEKGEPYDNSDKAMKEWNEEQKEWTTALYKFLKFTKAELNKIERGEEVYFKTSRLQEFLNAGLN